MSYEGITNLNDLSSAHPLDGASTAEIAQALRQLTAVVKNVLLQSHRPNGVLREVSADLLSESAIGSAQMIDKSVVSTKLGDKVVLEGHYADASIPTIALKDDAVTGPKIAANALAPEHFPAECVPLTALAAALASSNIMSSAVDDLLRAITSDHIKSGAIIDRHVNDVAVGKLSGGTAGQILVRTAEGWAPLSLAGGLSFNSVTNQFVVEPTVKVAHFADHKARGSNGGASVVAWTTRDLGEISDEGSIMAFSGNTFRLAVGTYLFFAQCPVNGAVGRHQARLLQTAIDSTVSVALWGSAEQCVASQSGVSTIQGMIEVTEANTVFKIEHWTQNAVASSGFGLAASSDNTVAYANHVEVYTSGYVTKLS